MGKLSRVRARKAVRAVLWLLLAGMLGGLGAEPMKPEEVPSPLKPWIPWALHGTAIRVRDIGLTLSRPLASSAVAAIIAFGIKVFCDQALSLPPRLTLEMFVFGITYLVMLLLVLGQKSFYVDMVRGLRSGVTPFGQPGR